MYFQLSREKYSLPIRLQASYFKQATICTQLEILIVAKFANVLSFASLENHSLATMNARMVLSNVMLSSNLVHFIAPQREVNASNFTSE